MKITATIPQSIIDAIRAGTDLALEVSMIAPASHGIDPLPHYAGTLLDRSAPDLAAPRTLAAQGARRITEPGTRHLYSRQEALSHDARMALVMQRDGHFKLLDLNATIGNLNVPPSWGLAGGNCDANWLDARAVYAVGQDGSIGGATVIDFGGYKTLFTIDDDGRDWAYAHSGAEGRPSRDGNRFPFMLLDKDFKCVRSVLVNENGTVLVSVPNRGDTPNHVTVSNSGRWFIVSRAATGSNAGPDPEVHAGTWAYEARGADYPVLELAKGSQHSDVCTGKDGRDYFIYADFDGNSEHAGKVWYCPIDRPDQRTVVLDTYGPQHEERNRAFHFSGCGPDGWVLASAYGREPAIDARLAWWDHRIFAIELGGDRRIALLGDHNSIYAGDYWQEPHACWSRDGRRIIFASNNRGAHQTASYVLDVPVLP